MPEERLDLVVSAKDDATSVLKKTKDAVQGVKSAVAGASADLDKFGSRIVSIPSSVKWAAAGIAAALAVTVRDASAAYMEAERATSRLYHLTRQTTGATEEQVAALEALAAAQQRLGVVDDDTAKYGQSQLATFALQTDTIAKLTPAMLDLAVAVDGVNVTQQSMMSIGNLVGKAMTGQASALSRYGVTMSEAQQKIIETGTEAERAAALVSILEQNFGGLNEATRQTAEGGIKAAKDRIGDLYEEIGSGLVPVLANAYISVADLGEALFATEGASRVAFNGFRNVAEGAAAMGKTLTDVYAAVGSLWTYATGYAGAAFTSVSDFLTGNDDTAEKMEEMRERLAGYGDASNAAQEALEDFTYRNLQAEQQLGRMPRAASGAAGALAGVGESASGAASGVKSLLGQFETLEKRMESLREQREEEDVKDAMAGLDARQKAAALYVEQEAKVMELTEKAQQAEGKVTMREMNELVGARDKAFAELQANSSIPMTMPAEYAEAVRRSRMSEFGTSLEDLRLSETRRQVERGGRVAAIESERAAARQTIFNFNFNGDVNDKETLKREVIDAINRQSAYVAAGA